MIMFKRPLRSIKPKRKWDARISILPRILIIEYPNKKRIILIRGNKETERILKFIQLDNYDSRKCI